VTGEIPSTAAYEDASSYAFADIHPQAPVHLLIVPRKHIPSLDATDEAIAACSVIFVGRRTDCTDKGLGKGYRVVVIPEKTAAKQWIISIFIS